MKTNTLRGTAAMSLPQVALRLRNERIDKVVAGYSECSMSVKRVGLMMLVLAWTFYWAHSAPHRGSDLLSEARTLMPWVIGLFMASLVWAIYLRLNRSKHGDWVEVVGAVANYLAIGLMLNKGWNITISIITIMPLATIVIGARYNRRAFIVAMIGSVALLGFAAPPGYWGARPAFIPFAVILLVGLPLTVNKLLSALYEVSAAAVQARDAQTRIIAMISHELRTPLNTICNATHVIDTSGLSVEDQSLMSSLATNANALLYRVNQVLDVAAIDNGRLHLSHDPLLLGTLSKAVRDVLGDRATDKGVSLDIRIAPSLADDDVLMGDIGRIEQVLTNLVSNAIKFTPPGGNVLIEIEPMAKSKATVDVRFRVSDTGTGISAANKALIFQPFVQVSTGAARGHEGVGLGLHIVRGVSDQMHGMLTVEDRPGGGSVFTWRLTLPKAEPGQHPASTGSVLDALAAHRASVPPMRILVIDDNHPNRDIMRRLLERAGHQSVLAPNGMVGLDVLRQQGETIDAVFLDAHMPGMSGEDVMIQLSRENNRTPIVVVSADSDPDVIGSFLAKGAVAYVMKPVSPQRIMDALQAVGAQSGVSTRRTEPTPAAATEPTGLALMRELGDPSAVRAYLDALREEIRDGLATIEDLIARHPADAAGTLLALHSMSGSLRNLGEVQAAEISAALSHAVRNGHDYSLPLRQLRVRVKQSLAAVDRELGEDASTPRDGSGAGTGSDA